MATDRDGSRRIRLKVDDRAVPAPAGPAARLCGRAAASGAAGLETAAARRPSAHNYAVAELRRAVTLIQATLPSPTILPPLELRLDGAQPRGRMAMRESQVTVTRLPLSDCHSGKSDDCHPRKVR
ncbi:MAG: hypothetical protein QOJ27_1767 [Sphingomonadales bacterium]|nr:hypothetical protein [Sphingomonadales bacterium]